MSDLQKRLTILASMIANGERIRWGQDSEVMIEAADEIEQLKQRIAQLERERDAILQEAKVNECELNTQKGIIQGVRDVFDLRVYDFNLIPALKKALAQRDIEQQEKGVNHVGAMLTVMGFDGVESLCEKAIEQIRKGGE